MRPSLNLLHNSYYPQIKGTGGLLSRLPQSLSGLRQNAPNKQLLNQGTLKNRPGVKACVIRPPETPSVFVD